MSKIVINQLIIIITISVGLFECQTKVSGQCGRPSVPPLARIRNMPLETKLFNEEQQLVILCPENEFFVKRNLLTCKKGQWSNFYKTALPRCAKNVNAQVTHLDIYDCGSTDNTLLVSQKLNVTEEAKSGIKLSQNAFQRTRVIIPEGSGYVISANGTQCYNYKLTFDQKIQFFYLVIDLYGQTNSTDQPVLTPFVNKYRTCQLIRNLSRPIVYKKPFVFFTYYFICDLKSNTDYKIENNDLLDTITMEIKTNRTNEFGLESVYLGQIFTNSKKTQPECGDIQINRIGVEVTNDVGITLINCNDSFVDLNLSDNITEFALNGNPKHQFVCDWNGVWTGSWPICVPIKTCSKDSFLYDKPETVIIEEIGNVYYLTESQWFAINGSFVRYSCLNGTDRMFGKNIRTCLKDGIWSDQPPYCSSSGMSGLVIAGILFSVLILFVSIFIFLFRLKSKRVEKKLKETRNEIQETNKKLETTDFYADTTQNDLNQYTEYNYEVQNNFKNSDAIELKHTSHQYLEITDTTDP